MLLLLTKMFFYEIHVFLQLRWTGLYGANRDYIHLETPKLEEAFLSKTIYIPTGKNVLILLLLNHMDLFWNMHVFLQLSWIGLFGAKWAFFHLKSSDVQEVLFPKLTQFSLGNKVLDVEASNIDGFLSRDTRVSSIQLKRPIGNKISLSPHWSL
jgi:hypothetical protein